MNSVASLWKWYLTNETRMTNFEKIIIENHDRSKIKNQSQRIILHFSQQQITREGTLDSSVKTVPPAQISRGNAFVRMVPISQTLRFLCSRSRNKVFFGNEWTRNHGKKKERKAGKKKRKQRSYWEKNRFRTGGNSACKNQTRNSSSYIRPLNVEFWFVGLNVASLRCRTIKHNVC